MRKVIVCGLGQVGYRVASLLLRLGSKVEVVVVSKDNRADFADFVTSRGATLIDGDVRLDANLIKAGVDDARAVIACCDKDLINIEVAMDVNRLNPETNVVVRLFDQNLARRLEGVIGIHKAYAMSALSAPAFASSAYGESIRGAFSWNGETLIIGEVQGSDRLQRLANEGQLTPIRRHSAIESASYKPENDECSQKHAIFEVLCRKKSYEMLTQLHDSTSMIQKAASAGKRKPSKFKAALASLAAIWQNVPKTLKLVAGVIFALAVLSVFVFQFALKLSPLDSVYFVTTTLTTTGYGDFSLKGADPWVIIYGCFVMLLGSATIATMYSIVTDFIVSTRFDQVLGRQRVASDDHVIVVGLSNVGYRTTCELRAMGMDVVVIDRNGDSEYRTLLDRGTPFIVGDARDAEVLRRAGIESATAVVTTTGDDAVNLSISLAVKALNSGAMTVVRLFDDAFCDKVKATMNVTAAFSATRIAAPAFVGSALFPDALYSCVIGDRFCVIRPANSKPSERAAEAWTAFEETNSPIRLELFPLSPEIRLQ